MDESGAAALAQPHNQPPPVADAFIGSRVGGDWGRAFGTLPQGTRCDEIIARSRVA